MVSDLNLKYRPLQYQIGQSENCSMKDQLYTALIKAFHMGVIFILKGMC